MDEACFILILTVLAVIVGYLISKRWVPKNKSSLSHDDIKAASHIISTFDKSQAYDLSNDEFQSLKDRVLLTATPKDGVKEEYQYYYDWPKWKYDTLGEPNPLPEGLFSRFYPIYSSFNTSGYYWNVRDGIHSTFRSPFGRWTSNNGRYYYVASY